MTYLLDTDTLIFLIRGLKASRSQSVRDRARRILGHCQDATASGNSVGVSAITVSELEFGARGSEDYDTEMAAVRKTLFPFTAHEYDTVLCPPHYGRIRSSLEAEGVPIGSMDLLISAHALALEATLVTNNLRHFGRVADLKTANWLAAP